jgi:hypothetical protein
MTDTRTWLGSALLAWALAGCVPSTAAFDVLDAELPGYAGRPVGALVDRLGYPDDERRIMGKTTYIWQTSDEQVSVHNSPSLIPGYGYDTNVRVIKERCRIRVRVDDAGVITWWGYNGDNAACRTYARRLAPRR